MLRDLLARQWVGVDDLGQVIPPAGWSDEKPAESCKENLRKELSEARSPETRRDDPRRIELVRDADTLRTSYLVSTPAESPFVDMTRLAPLDQDSEETRTPGVPTAGAAEEPVRRRVVRMPLRRGRLEKASTLVTLGAGTPAKGAAG